MRKVVGAARPDAIVHEATALAGLTDLKHFDASFAETNRLRTEGTDALLAAAREAGRGAKRCDTVSRHTAIARPAATLRV